MKISSLTFLTVLLFSSGLFAQQTITNEKHERIVSHAYSNVYDVIFLNNDGRVVQEGHYWKEGNVYKPHGIWVLYAHNSDEIATKAKFHRGKRLSIETKIDGKVVKAGEQQLTLRK